MTDKRLKAVAAYVRKGSRAADIGTDHGYLPVYLVEEGICPFVIASDLRQGPLDTAQRNVKKAGLEDKISCRLAFGLEGVKPFEVTDIIIAGMGGELIAEIMEQCDWLKSEEINLILQPMTKPELLRKYLHENSFSILSETATSHAGKYYTVINAVFSDIYLRETQESEFYTGKLKGTDGNDAYEYLTCQANRLKKKIEGLKSLNTPCQREIGILTEILNAAERIKSDDC